MRSWPAFTAAEMSSKRGRPLSGEGNDPAVERRRQLTRERVRQHRLRRTHVNGHANRPSEEQLHQSEHIVDLTLTEQEQAATTLLQLGLRVQGVTLAQDAADAQLQRQALPIDEHAALYQYQTPESPEQIPSRQSSQGFFRQFAARTDHETATGSCRPNQADLSRFFRSLPPTSPFAKSSLEHPHPSNSVSKSSSEQQTSAFHADDTPIIASENSSNLVPIETTATTIDEDERPRVSFSTEAGVDLPIRSPDSQARAHLRATGPSGGEEHDVEESMIDFAPARSTDSESGGEDAEEISAHEHTVHKIYEELQHGFHGCTEDDHREALRQHMADAGENHHGLGEIFNDMRFPSVLGLSDMITPERLARQQTPTSEQWANMFCGNFRGGRLRRPMNVCLHTEQTQAVEPQVSFDVDSFLGFAWSLGFARRGIWLQLAPQMRQNMTSDVHLETNVFRATDDPEQPTQSSLEMLRDVPHFLLGRVEGAHDITLHVLFPHMQLQREKFVALGGDQLARWTDQVLLPAIHQSYPAHYTQHLPASYHHALANSKAYQVEGRKIDGAGYRAQLALGHHLQPEYLEQVWSNMLDIIGTTPGLADFREPQLFFGAKGAKLQFKNSSSRPTLLDVMDGFQSYFESVADMDFVDLDRFYVDLGKEICPQVSLLQSEEQHTGDEAQVYSWKRCCLGQYMDWMYDGRPPPPTHQGHRYYDQNMLYQASSLTTVTAKRSKLRLGGLIYSQFYGSVKEVSDAAKCKPFDNDGLEEMALDPHVRQGARNATGGRRREAKIVEQAYLASKRRAREAIRASRKKSFGIREEHRVSWELFQGLRARLQSQERDSLEIVLADCPSYAWAVRTEVYLNYLWRSADKFATGFEVVRAKCRNDTIRWEQTKMMAMFLRCLRFVFGGFEIRRESALWWSRRERTVGEPARVRVWYGLGFCNTLSRYGYCWLEPRVDWSRLEFKALVTDSMLFGNGSLRRQYLRRGGQVQEFFDLTRRLESAVQWIERNGERDRICERLLRWMAHVCLQQFRADVLHSVQQEISEEYRETALQAKEGFCMEYFDEIMTDGVHVVSGNRSDFKKAHQLGRFLFDFDDGRTRRHWEDRPYRKLYQLATGWLESLANGRVLVRTFQIRVSCFLYEYHWILPYPTADGLLPTTKQGRRMWYSIVATEDDQGTKSGRWTWGRKAWEPGRPRELPGWTDWGKEDWERWIGDSGGFVDDR